MSTTQRSDEPGRMLGYGGLALAIAGAAAIIALDGSTAFAIGVLVPLIFTAVLGMLPTTRDNSVIWLVTGIWTGSLGLLSIFSVGIIFLIATVFLLAAFVKANW